MNTHPGTARHPMGKALSAVIAMLLVWALLASPAVSNASGSSPALTSAPPSGGVVPFSIFDPSHIYLDSGSASISAVTGSVNISASTTATMTVNTIGVKIYLQKWDGTNWNADGTPYTGSNSNASSYTANVSKTTVAGYYYRIRTVHYVTHSGVTEQGELYSGSVLAK